MARTAAYREFTIQSTPHYRTEWQEWQLRIAISCDTSQGVRTRDFSSEIMYPTEQEADFHGITFGQHLIDGKVEGQSVIDMTTAERRRMPRLRVQFRTTFSDATKMEGIGILLDLSVRGCRIESPTIVVPGFSLELRIRVPDLDWPLMIETATVQWVSGQTFG